MGWASALTAAVPLQSGGIYSTPHVTRTTDGPGSGALRVAPIIIPNAVTVHRIGVEVVAGSASWAVHIGLYADDGGFPDALLSESGALDASTPGTKWATVDLAIGIGRYWLAALGIGSAGTLRAMNDAQHILLPAKASDGGDPGAVGARCLTATGLSGLPDPFPAGGGPGTGRPALVLLDIA